MVILKKGVKYILFIAIVLVGIVFASSEISLRVNTES